MFLVPFLHSQTTWSGAGDALTWDDFSNWSNGVPNSTNGAVFNVDTGGTALLSALSVASVTFNSGAGANQITYFGSGALTVNGAISNNTFNIQTFDIVLTAGGSATWKGSIVYSNIVNIGANQITLTGSHAFSGQAVNFSITNALTYGNFIATGSPTFTSNVHINISSGSYAFVAGNTFDFTTGNFSGVSLSNVVLPTLSGGLTWNTTNFISSGVLSVAAIPEPSAYAALFGAAAIGFSVWRKRRKV